MVLGFIELLLSTSKLRTVQCVNVWTVHCTNHLNTNSINVIQSSCCYLCNYIHCCYFNWHLSKQKLHHYMYICSILAGYRLDSFVCQQNQLLILCWTHREKYFVKTKIFLKFKVEQSCLLSILWENAQKLSWNQSAWWFSKQICSEDCICSDVSMYIVYLFLIIIL